MAAENEEFVKSLPKSNAAAVLTGSRQMALMAEAHLRLFRQIEAINHAWSESVRRARESETKFARRLIDCRDAARAAELCAEWLTTRAATFVTESQRFTGLWLNFYSETGKDAWNGATLTQGSVGETPAETKSEK